MTSKEHIRIGTSGWSYPKGRGTWNGVFYPTGGRSGGRLDELAFYARFFDTVEVNSSFYRPPAPDTVRRWAQRTPPGFEFSLKLYQKFTHPKMYRAAAHADASVSAVDVDTFRAALDPLAERNSLGMVLAQFPPSFKAEEASRDYLAWVLESFEDYPVAVELRHRSWSDDAVGTASLLGSHDAALVQIDEPKFSFSIRQDRRPNSSRYYYARLHGRNAASWWRHDAAEDRYDYFYSKPEIGQLRETLAPAREIARKVYVYFNNHFAAKAVANAAQLKDELGLPAQTSLPGTLIKQYPELRALSGDDGTDSLPRL